MKRAVPFKQGDVARALRAANSAGMKVARVEIEPNGKLCVVMIDGDRVEQPASPFDAWKEGRDARPTERP